MEQIGHADAAFRKAGTYDIRRARCFLRFRGIVINLRKSTERGKGRAKIVSSAWYSLYGSYVWEAQLRRRMLGFSLKKKG